MTHDEKVARFRSDMKAQGIGSWTSAPPIYRICWRLGLKVRPPQFQGFLQHTVMLGTYFGIFWGATMWFAFWRWSMSPRLVPWLPVSSSVVAGLFFGLAMAAYYRRQARRLGLPPWDRYPVV